MPVPMSVVTVAALAGINAANRLAPRTMIFSISNTVLYDTRTEYGPGPLGPHRAADAEAGREPELFHQRIWDDRERARRRFGVSARVRRLRASHAEADRVEAAGDRARGVSDQESAGAGAAGGGAEGDGMRVGLERRGSVPWP